MGKDRDTTLIDTAATGFDLATGTPAGSITRALVGGVWKLADRIEAARVKRALDLLVESLATVADLPRDEAASRLQELLDGASAEVDDLLYADFKSKASARSEAAWPYIARLTAEYLHHGQPADSFFKRMGLLLERCEGEDVRVLCGIAGEARRLSTEHGIGEDFHFLGCHPCDGGMEVCLNVGGMDRPVSIKADALVPLDELHGLDLCEMINQGRLGPQNNNGFSEIPARFARPLMKIMA